MAWRIDYYCTERGDQPVKDFIDSLPVKLRAKNMREIAMLEEFGTDRFLEVLREMGFTTIDKDADHYGLSLILGGAEITLETLARAYYYLAAELAGDTVFEELCYLADAKRDRLPARRIPISRAAPWSSETASIACPGFVFPMKVVRPNTMTSDVMIVTIVSPLMVICPPASLSAGTLTTDVKDLELEPNHS